MFEKEAEEAGNEKIKENHQFARCARKSYKDGFKDGAEFGYNKCDEQLTKAKKLIIRFIMGNVYFYGKETDLVEKAKQFLRELKE